MRSALRAGIFIGLSLGVATQDAATLAEAEKNRFVFSAPDCARCPSHERATYPAIGFALEIGYGYVKLVASSVVEPVLTWWLRSTASIRHYNGTFENVARVDASAEYLALMQDLATSPVGHLNDGLYRLSGVNKEDLTTVPMLLWFYIKRWLNKLAMRPATPETRVAAEMVAQLRRQVEERLGHRIQGAVLSTPDRFRLTGQEVGDIFDYLGVEDLYPDENNQLRRLNQLYGMTAAMVGYGMGLCSNYMDASSCARQDRLVGYADGFHVDFGRWSLSVSSGSISTVKRYFSLAAVVNVTLGLDNAPGDPLEADGYWEDVESLLRSCMSESRGAETTVLLTGESASNTRFIKALKRASSPAILVVAAPETPEQFLFATSMGAAELAKRRQEGMAVFRLPTECRVQEGLEDSAGSARDDL